MEIKLTRKRDMIRNKTDFSEHQIVTLRKKPYGIWLNVEALGDTSKEDQVKFLASLLDWLYG